MLDGESRGSLSRPPLDWPAEPTPHDWDAVNAVRAQLDRPEEFLREALAFLDA